MNKILNDESIKYCYMNEDELKECIKNDNNIWKSINIKKIKTIEALYNDDIYVLLKDGRLYKNGKQILDNISDIWSMTINLLFVITNDNYIYSLQKTVFNEYISNIKYKKIIKSDIDLLALTYDRKVKSLTSPPGYIGVIPDNFVDVDDIYIKNSTSAPIVYKKGKKIFLYVSNYNE